MLVKIRLYSLMFSETDIIAKAWMLKEIANLVLAPEHLSVDKILLVGSYASGRADEWSDIDFVLQLKGGTMYPRNTPEATSQIYSKLQDEPKIQFVFGTVEAADALHKKHANEKKNYAYRILPLEGLNHSYKET
jgi:predicted nucleotidyltransferase